MIICADDYGLREDIDNAILELVGQRKISAVSCMTLFKRFNADTAQRLLQFNDRVSAGLHLCFTDEGIPLSTTDISGQGCAVYPDFSALLKKSVLGTLQKPLILSSIKQQHRFFTEKFGQPPEFIDGHLHAHQLPGVRQALIEFVSTLTANQRPAVRNTALPLRTLWSHKLPLAKATTIGWFGAAMRRGLMRVQIPTNTGFAGIYNFEDHLRYRDYLPKFLRCLSAPLGMLVCHPGRNDLWRLAEVEALSELSIDFERLHRFSGAACESSTTPVSVLGSIDRKSSCKSK